MVGGDLMRVDVSAIDLFPTWSKRTVGGDRARRRVRSWKGGSAGSVTPRAMSAHVLMRFMAPYPSDATW